MLNEKQRQTLLSLGTTKEEVAQNLTKLGIKGGRYTCQKCPIGNLIGQQSTFWESFWHGSIPIRWIETINNDTRYEAIRAFITAFDNGEFPDLIDSTKEDPNYVAIREAYVKVLEEMKKEKELNL